MAVATAVKAAADEAAKDEAAKDEDSVSTDKKEDDWRNDPKNKPCWNLEPLACELSQVTKQIEKLQSNKAPQWSNPCAALCKCLK